MGNLSEVIIDDTLSVRNNNELHDVQKEVNQRVNKDSVVNNYGRMLTQMCKNLDFIIVNGRCGTDATVGQFTCKNVSCVDYAIVSKSLLCAVSVFKVLEFHEILSDIHSPIELHISFTCNPHTRSGDMEESNLTEKNRPKWNGNYKDNFTRNLSSLNVDTVTRTIQAISNNADPKLDDINELITDGSTLITESAETSNMLNKACIKKEVGPRKRYHDHKPWYTNECEVKRKEYFKFKNRYGNLRTHENEVKMVTASKQYQIQIKKAFREHHYKENSLLKVI